MDKGRQLDVRDVPERVADEKDIGFGPLASHKDLFHVHVALAANDWVSLRGIYQADLGAEMSGEGRHPRGTLFDETKWRQCHQLAMEGMPRQPDAKVRPGKLDPDGLFVVGWIAQLDADLGRLARAADGLMLILFPRRRVFRMMNGNGRAEACESRRATSTRAYVAISKPTSAQASSARSEIGGWVTIRSYALRARAS
jgi:hypothetical protein